MKLRTKFKLAFIFMTVIPAFVILTILFLIGFIHIKSIENKYEIQEVGINHIMNPAMLYSQVTEKDYDIIVNIANNEPYKLENEEYIHEINDVLLEKYSYIIVKKGEEILLDGSGKNVYEDFPESLGYYSYTEDSEEGVFLYGDYKYLIKHIKFTYDDGEMGDVYIATEIGMLIPQLKRMLGEMIITVVVIVVITGILLGVWMQKSVIWPLKKLGDAIRKIGDGELDFELNKETDDEIGVLYDEFEDMRLRLRDTAQARIQDDVENKELISNISHDLKTPLTSIKGYVEGIMDGIADTPEKMNKYIKTIYNKTNDMDKLIGELTMYSRIDTNRIPYDFKKVNVDEYFSDCAEEISTELEAGNISLSYKNNIDKDTIIIADPEQLKRVINNIVSNSVKYIGNKEGRLNITINDEHDYIHVEIEDNGKGIEQKNLSRIFDRFYRTDSSRNSKQGGSGIGLAISRKIIEMHGGSIWATSKLGEGTTIHFIIRKYYEPEVIKNE